QVADARLALASLAAAFYGDPSHALRLIGITGTNGKTTTTYLVAAIFEAAGVICGRIGTIGTRVGDHEAEAARTTPEAPDLQPLTYAIDTAADVRAVGMSLSLEGLAFDVESPRGRLHLRSPLVGRPNVYNILAAAATALALDVPIAAIEQGVAALSNVPGRF